MLANRGQLSTACLGCCSARKLSGLVLRQRGASDITKPDAAGRNWTSFCERSPRRQVTGCRRGDSRRLYFLDLGFSYSDFVIFLARTRDSQPTVSPQRRLVRLVG